MAKIDDFVKDFIDKKLPHVTKYGEYIKDTNWCNKRAISDREAEYKVQDKIIKNIVDRLKYFVNKTENETPSRILKDTAKKMSDIIEVHINRVDFYLNKIDISKSKDKTSDIEFQNILFRDITKLEETMLGINIDFEESTNDIEFLDNTKAPLSMHDILSKQYPVINRKMEEMGIDFDSPPKNEMLIYMKNIPEWNPDKHYFEQHPDTLQFFVDEFKKIKYGIEIDGIFIHPWMYYHLNVFITNIPEEVKERFTGRTKNEDNFIHPPLRDNEWFIIQDSYRDAEIKQKILFLAASRRISKTTLLASHYDWKCTTGHRKLLLSGGSSKDLGQVADNIKITNREKHPAFHTPIQRADWEKEIEFGIKKKNNKTLLMCTLKIVNLVSGRESSSEELAGFTPDAFGLDEAMKLPFKTQLEALLPALDTPHGKRCVAMLLGTGGNATLSKDALLYHNDPETYGVLPMDWNKLEERVPEECITWKRRNFGTFLPAQMSAKVGMLKKEISLADYLNKSGAKNLNKIKIKVTDWSKCHEIILRDREKLKNDQEGLRKEKTYYPIDPEEVFLSDKESPFPVEEAKKQKKRIIEEGRFPRQVDLFREGDKIIAEESNKLLPKYPHGGGFHDSPVLLFEEIPKVKPPFGMYVCGLDDYKYEEAQSDSLGSMYIFKRAVMNNEMAYKIVASLTTRPDPHSKAHRYWLMMQEAFNAQCNMENADIGYKEYLDKKYITDIWLTPTFSLGGDITLSASRTRKYGTTPQGKNKTNIVSAVVKYTNDEHVIGYDNEGNEIKILGIELIDDVTLLDEIIAYREGSGNYDRIVAFGCALLQDYYLTSNYILFNENPKPKEEKKKVEEKKKIRNRAYRKSTGNFFRK